MTVMDITQGDEHCDCYGGHVEPHEPARFVQQTQLGEKKERAVLTDIKQGLTRNQKDLQLSKAARLNKKAFCTSEW